MKLAVLTHHKTASRWLSEEVLPRLFPAENVVRVNTGFRGVSLVDFLAAARSADVLVDHNSSPLVGLLLRAEFPDAKVVHTVRHPLGVVKSSYFSHAASHPLDGWPELGVLREALGELSIEDGLLLDTGFNSSVWLAMRWWDLVPQVQRVEVEALVTFEGFVKFASEVSCELDVEQLAAIHAELSLDAMRSQIGAHYRGGVLSEDDADLGDSFDRGRFAELLGPTIADAGYGPQASRTAALSPQISLMSLATAQLRSELDAALSQRSELATQLSAVSDELVTARSELSVVQAQRLAAEQSLERMRDRHAAERSELERAAVEAKNDLAMLHSSRTWRYGHPVARAVNEAQRLLRTFVARARSFGPSRAG